VQSASPAECQLVEEVIARTFLDELPASFVGDKAYDSDALDQKLADEYHIELIAPNQQCRSQTQGGRKLRRYRRRGKVERLFAGCTTSAASSPAGSITSRTSSALFNSPVFTSCSGIYD
jgi:hypothetical protein